MNITQTNLGGINLYNTPLDNGGQFLQAINVDSYPYGGIIKRPGYTSFLGTSNGSAVQNIFQWTKDDGSQSYLYAKKGNVLYYYDVTAGTGDWSVCENGTFSGTANVGYGVLDNTLIVGDGVGSTRHTTSGTSFTNTSLAPVASDFEQFQNRIYAMGTANDLFYSTTGDATDWSSANPSDSGSFLVPGEGRLTKITKVDNKLFTHKASGNMFSWDGDYLIDMATNYGLSSPQSFSKTEGYGFWLNRMGIYGFGGGMPELLSAPVQPYIYNRFQTGIAGTTFDNAPGACFKYDYYLSVGTISDDIIRETIPNAVLKYNFQRNMFHVYSFANKPTSMSMYEDSDGVEHLLFGDSTGQVYKFGGTATSDNGTPIEARTELIIATSYDFKKWYDYTSVFNPGSKAKLQIGFTDTFRREGIKWVELGDTSMGAVHGRIPQSTRSLFADIRITENSSGEPFQWYGYDLNFELDNPR